MPGRFNDLARQLDRYVKSGIQRIVSLASLDEIKKKSQSYASAIEAGDLPVQVEFFEIRDYDIPEHYELFDQFIKRLIGALQSGERLLIHCGAGVGRTGLVAECLLVAFGASANSAAETVRSAGSGPETELQRRFVQDYASRLRNVSPPD